jgi:hypothetical protein
MPATYGQQRNRTCPNYQASYKKPEPFPHSPTFQLITATLCNFGTFSLDLLNNTHERPYLSALCQSLPSSFRPALHSER